MNAVGQGIAGVICLLFFGASFAGACECEVQSFAKQVDAARTVMVVRVTSVRDNLHAPDRINLYDEQTDLFEQTSTYGRTVQFDVLRVYKKPGTIPTSIQAPGYGRADCGVVFAPGGNYLVLLDDLGWTTACSGTQKVGFQDMLSCPIQNWLEQVGQRAEGGHGEVAERPAQVDEWDARVAASLARGEDPFLAACASGK